MFSVMKTMSCTSFMSFIEDPHSETTRVYIELSLTSMSVDFLSTKLKVDVKS